ncbi:MAG: SusD/RagB family nutrient-binding outer rane lipoprotein [Segetibacter sp.]|nr:SusD/RagB family nutrient-binding outer rane lipoprotein [Segetibacter sp.]
MKSYKKLSYTVILIAGLLSLNLLSSCTKNYSEVNSDPSKVTEITSGELPFLFTRALHGVYSSYQTDQNLFADLYAQYYANTSVNFATDRLAVQHAWSDAVYTAAYSNVMPQLQILMQKVEPTSPEYALSNIWWVFTFHRVTDYFGPIPYSQAGSGEKNVAYDPMDKVYADFFKRLNDAVTVLKQNTASKPFGAADLIYAGDVSKWIKFANTLRLRLALRISAVDPARAKTEAEAAVAGGVLESSPADDALMKRGNATSAAVNPLSSMSEYNEFRMSATMESIMKGYQDPRISVYWIPARANNEFNGFRNGYNSIQLGNALNSNAANSHVGPRWSSPASGGLATFESTPVNVMSAAEADFLRAEGDLLGWRMGDLNAKAFYEKGMRNSMVQWGVSNSAAIDAYISSNKLPVAPQDFLNSPAITNVPIAFHPTSRDIQLEQIAIQKWLAVFPDGKEAWADIRRHRRFKLYQVVNSDNPNITNTATQWVRRLPYPDKEYQVNRAEITKAVQLLKGSDTHLTPLWWDKN